MITYTIATGAEYYGGGTDEERRAAAEFIRDRLIEMVQAEFPEVDISFRLVHETGSYGNRSIAETDEEAEILELIEAAQQDRWDVWLAHSLVMDDLYAVLTTSEVAELYNLDDSTPKKAAQEGAIPARKSGGTWLIRREDAEARWGKRK